MKLKNMNHTCIKRTEHQVIYHVNNCKACRKITAMRKEKTDFENMMSISMQWDTAEQGSIL